MLLNLINFRNLAILSLALIPLVFSHYRVPSVGGTGLAVPANIAVWLGSSLFILFSSLSILKSKTLRYNFFSIAVLIAFACCFVPILYTESRFLILESYRFYGLVGGILVFVCVLQLQISTREKNIIAWSALIGACIEAVLGMMQYYILQPGNVFAYDVFVDRPYGTINQYNAYAIWLVSGLSIAFYLFRQFQSNLKARVIIGLSVYFLALPILVNQSRVGLFSLVLILVFGSVWLAYSKVPKSRISVLVFIAFLGYFTPKYLTDDLIGLGVESAESQSTTEIIRQSKIGTRVTIYPVSWQLFLEEPIKGHGYGTFRAKYLEKQGEYIQREQRQLSGGERVPAEFYLAHPHNELLYWLVEGGVLGSLIVIVPALLIAFTIFKRGFLTGGAFAMVLLPISAHTMLEVPFYVSAYLFIHFCVLVGLLADYKTKLISLRFGLHYLSLLALPIFYAVLVLLDNNRVTSENMVKFNHFQKQDTKYLLSSPRVNTFDERIIYELMHFQLRKSKEQGEFDGEFLEKYLRWSYSQIQSVPRPELYRNLAQIFLMVGYPDKAVATSNRARMLYPYEEKTVAQNIYLVKNYPQFKDQILEF